MTVWRCEGGSTECRQRVFGTESFGRVCNVPGYIVIHLYDSICNMEKSTGASGYQDSGNTSLFIKLTCTFQKGGNRLLFTLYYLLHKSIPYHKVGGRGILIQQKKMAACFHAFHDSGCLGGTSTGILGRKTMGILLVGQVIDKQGDVYILNETSIFWAKLDSSAVCDHIFSAVSGDMVVYAKFQCIEKSRLTVITTAYNEGDSLPYLWEYLCEEAP